MCFQVALSCHFADIDTDTELNKDTSGTYQRLRGEVLGLLKLVITNSIKGGTEDRWDLVDVFI